MMRNALPVLTQPPLLPLKHVASNFGSTSHLPLFPQSGSALAARVEFQFPRKPVDQSGDKGPVHLRSEQAPCFLSSSPKPCHKRAHSLELALSKAKGSAPTVQDYSQNRNTTAEAAANLRV
jgi:hypothetical protein